MKQHFVFAAIALIVFGVMAGYHALFPPPPADYRIVYLGSKTCGICKHWKARVLPEWQRDPASKTAELELARLNGNPFRGGYGAHNDVFQEAFGNKRRISYPSFVLYNHGEIERVFVGLSGWNAIEKRVRSEAKRVEKLTDRDLSAAPDRA
ncbi:MAG: hypothetical protein AAGJ84_15875 [Pseudomonadota bacterium]